MSRRLYRALLRIAPARLRDRHGAGMEALFLETLDGERNTWRRAAIWLRALVDLASSRAREPFRRRSTIGDPPGRKGYMLGTDLKYACRWLVRQKYSTSLVVGILALGIAANVVVFSLVNGLFLRPFPFAESDRLIYVNETAPKWNLDVVGINYPDFHHWRQNAKLFEGMAIWDDASMNFSDGKVTERIDGAAITHEFFDVLRVRPRLGRMFTAGEDKPGGPPVVVISEGLWRERFGGADDVLSKTLKLNGVTHTIIGVMPAVASFPGDYRFWVPYAGDPALPWQAYGTQGAIARLKPGVSITDAEKDLLRAQEGIWSTRDKERNVSPFTRDLREMFSRDFRTQAKVLLVAVVLLLVVACANVASVMLARALIRRREMGIRLAVGASRAHLARQLFVENLLLSAAGGALGLAGGRSALGVLLASAGDQVPPWASFDLDARVLGFALVVSVGTALLFGFAPALHAIRASLRGAMHDTGTGTTSSPGGRRTLSALVVAEFALAAVLLVGGGLLFRAYDRVQHVDPGFRLDDRVLTFAVALPDSIYSVRRPKEDDDRSKALAFWDRLEDRLRALPGVESAGLVSCVPLSCHWGTFYLVEGGPPPAPGQPHPVTLYRPTSPGYFPAMGIRLKSGRFFTPEDGRGDNRVVIVNETFVKTFWPNLSDPAGRRIRGMGSNTPWMTVVGFVADVKHYGLERPMRPGIYLPLRQAPSLTMNVAIRTTGDAAAVTPLARRVLGELDPDLAMYRVQTMDETLRRSLAQRRLYSWLLAVFASIALVLAVSGAYGVTSYLISQRTREIGIRVALGARTADISRAVLRSGVTIAATGTVVGVAGAVALSRYIADLLFGVKPYDALILTATAATLLLVAATANWLPARRAARVDPMLSLRGE
jgi:predicted permease